MGLTTEGHVACDRRVTDYVPQQLVNCQGLQVNTRVTLRLVCEVLVSLHQREYRGPVHTALGVAVCGHVACVAPL